MLRATTELRFYPIFLAFLLGIPVSGLALNPGEEFQDCAACPHLIVIPSGSFVMGDRAGTGHPRELPVHTVHIKKSIAVGKFAVTYNEWDFCVDSGGCDYRPSDRNQGRGNRAVDLLSWDDAKTYTDWLSKHTGKSYRLLSEAEWEYVRRAGSNTNFAWGDRLGTGNANCVYCGTESLPQTIPVGSFPPNAFGLHDMVGGVNEWIADCENNNYVKAPQDGSAWLDPGNCERRGVRGGSIHESEKFQLLAVRYFRSRSERSGYIGFRVARIL